MIRRTTIQKKLVLDAVNSLRNHATANEIYECVSAEHPNISKGTVYRNLNCLVEEREIRKLEVSGDPERFDHICTTHYHVRCSKCGQVFDVDMDVISDLKDRIKDKHGFEFLDHDIIFKGVCPNCQKK